VEHIDAITPTPSFPFIPITVELPSAQLDVASHTVLRYFEAERADDKREQADAFDHLVAICYRAVQPYFLRDRHGSLTVIDVPQFDSIKGDRTGHSRRKEGAALDATREWIQGWLLRFLAPYHDKSESELIEVADGDSFRYIGRKCKLRLKSTVCRKYKREENERTIYVAACACGERDIKQRKPRKNYICQCGAVVPYVADEYPAFTGFVGIEAFAAAEDDDEAPGDRIGTNRQVPLSSLATHGPFDEVMLSVENACRIVSANVEQLGRLDLLTGLLAYLSEAEHVEEPYFEGLLTRTIAGMRGVSETAARAYKRKFHRTMDRELFGRNPLIQSIFRELEQESPRPFVASTGSSEYRERKRLLREARQITAEFANDCRAQGLTRSAEQAARGERKALSAEDGLWERLASEPEQDRERFLADYQPKPGPLPS
jgi:hypothetical protein